MKYKFYYTVEIPDNKCDDDFLQKYFSRIAKIIQLVDPFDEDDWDFCVARDFDEG